MNSRDENEESIREILKEIMALLDKIDVRLRKPEFPVQDVTVKKPKDIMALLKDFAEFR